MGRSVTAPAGEDRIVDAVVAPLTQHAQVRGIECQFWRVSNFDDVMHNKPPLGLTAGRAMVASLDDEAAPKSVPCSLAEVGAWVLGRTPVVRVRWPTNLRQVLGVTAMRTESPRVRVWPEHRSARITRTVDTLSSCRTRPTSSRLATFRTARFSPNIVRPAEEILTAGDALRGDLAAWRTSSQVAHMGAAPLLGVLCRERFGTGEAGFQHSQLYHVQVDSDLVRDCVGGHL